MYNNNNNTVFQATEFLNLIGQNINAIHSKTFFPKDFSLPQEASGQLFFGRSLQCKCFVSVGEAPRFVYSRSGFFCRSVRRVKNERISHVCVLYV